MTHDELIEALIGSNREDWLRNSRRGVFTFKPNLDITVREVEEDEGVEPFPIEAWAAAAGIPARGASVVVFQLWYGASFVREYSFVSVYGDARLPHPRGGPEDLTISQEEWAIACAVNLNDNFDVYFRRAGVRVV